MRERLTEDRLRAFMRALGRRATVEGRVYITGGATAVLLGWRTSTLDVDIKVVPDHDAVLRLIPAAIEPLLYRYPAIDAARFRKAVEATVRLQ